MTQVELRQNLAENIKFYRKRLGLTQEKLAEKTGLSAQTINDIEGCRTWVSDKSLIKISDVLQTTPSDLLLPSDVIEKSKPISTNLEIFRLKNQITNSINTEIEKIFSVYSD